MSSRGEEEEQRGEERGKGEEQSELDEGFICRRTFSTGSCHELVLERVVAGCCQSGARPAPVVPVRGTNRS